MAERAAPRHARLRGCVWNCCLHGGGALPRTGSRANSWIELARTVAFAAGPASAGILVGWAGGSVAFGCAAALSCGAVVLLAGLHEPLRPHVPVRHPLRDLRDGIGFVFGHRLLLPVFVTLFLFNTAFFTVQAVYVPYAISHLGLTSAGVGATLGAFGVGMIGGALCAPRMLEVMPFGKVVALGPLIAFTASILLTLTIVVPSVWLAAGSFLLLGVGPPFWVISTTTLRQAVTPPEMLGRSFAINILAYGARPLGATLGAVLGSAYGVEVCIVAAAFGFFLQALVPLVSPLRRLDRQPELAR